jgi:type IV pilus assembly protein PilA
MKISAQGFSLIEIMIVIGIIAILSVIAIPTYKNYLTRARFVEVISATEPFKIAVAVALQTGTPLTEINNDTIGLPAPVKTTKNLARITVDKGIITATGTNLVENKTYILKPDSEGNTWSVDGTCIKAGLCNVG